MQRVEGVNGEKHHRFFETYSTFAVILLFLIYLCLHVDLGLWSYARLAANITEPRRCISKYAAIGSCDKGCKQSTVYIFDECNTPLWTCGCLHWDDEGFPFGDVTVPSITQKGFPSTKQGLINCDFLAIPLPLSLCGICWKHPYHKNIERLHSSSAVCH